MSGTAMRCVGCGVEPSMGDVFDACADCEATLCDVCMAKGHCGSVPARSWAMEHVRPRRKRKLDRTSAILSNDVVTCFSCFSRGVDLYETVVSTRLSPVEAASREHGREFRDERDVANWCDGGAWAKCEICAKTLN